jgi:hypothetical protein
MPSASISAATSGSARRSASGRITTRKVVDASALERAFQLAKSGRVAYLEEIVSSLKREGYSVRLKVRF